MKELFKLSRNQWKLLANALSNISQGIVLFSLATIFIPEAVGLPKSFSFTHGVNLLIGGLFLLLLAVIISKKGS